MLHSKQGRQSQWFVYILHQVYPQNKPELDIGQWNQTAACVTIYEWYELRSYYIDNKQTRPRGLMWPSISLQSHSSQAESCSSTYAKRRGASIITARFTNFYKTWESSTMQRMAVNRTQVETRNSKSLCKSECCQGLLQIYTGNR